MWMILPICCGPRIGTQCFIVVQMTWKFRKPWWKGPLQMHWYSSVFPRQISIFTFLLLWKTSVLAEIQLRGISLTTLRFWRGHWTYVIFWGSVQIMLISNADIILPEVKEIRWSIWCDQKLLLALVSNIFHNTSITWTGINPILNW